MGGIRLINAPEVTEIILGWMIGSIRLASPDEHSQVANMKLRLLVELDPETNRWSAGFPELPGCASAGDTEAESVANAKEALELWFEPTPVKMNKGAKLMELAVP